MNRSGSFAVMAALFLCAACGGGGDDGSGGGTTPPPPPPTTGIGASGGMVSEASGAKVVIPAGALATSTDIKVTQTSTGAPALPADVTAAGPIYAFTPHGTAFSKAVTITVPFDPTKVPTGTTPVLYKTDGSLTTWTAVPGATVSGNVMNGDVTGFSDAVVGITQTTPIQKHWTVELYDIKGNRESYLEGNGTGFLDLMDWIYLPKEDRYPTYYVHSTESGRTFWAQSDAPVGDGSYIGARTALTQTYYFRVDEESPALRFLITHATLIAFDGGGNVPSRYACPWLGENPSADDLRVLCNGSMTRAEAAFRIEARSLSNDPLLYRAGGTVEVTGVHADWRPRVTGDMTEHALFLTSDFVFDDDADGDSQKRFFRGKLKEPKRVELPIGTLHKGDIFAVQVFLTATAIDYIQGESDIAALMQDPVDATGIDFESTGLAQIEPQPLGFTPPLPALTCTTGPNPAAGSLQFSQASYSEPERSESAFVYVNRVGGTTGEVSVQLQAADGTALSGADYLPPPAEIRFGDGDDAPRRVEIPLVGDDVAEPDKALTVSLSNIGGCAQLGATTTATVNILDDDRPLPVQPTFALGGTVTGLQGSGLALETNFINTARPSANGPFTFARRVDDGTQYSVRVATQPSAPAQVCTVTHGSGTVAGADITDIAVSCVTPPPAAGLDTGFGSQGKLFAPAGADKLAQQPDGKLLVLGITTVSRFNSDGTVDASFGTGGKLDFNNIGNPGDRIAALAVQPDGKIVVTGWGYAAPSVAQTNFVTFRFNANGSLDNGFGTAGRVATGFDGNFDEASAVLLQPDGKILVLGKAQINKSRNVGGVLITVVDQDFGVVRYLPDGSLDAAFGSGGKSSLDAGGLDYLKAAALQADGNIVAVGRTTVPSGTGNPDMAVMRFLANGTPDPVFGNGGIERIDIATGIVPGTFNGGLADEALDVALQSDGKLLVGGYSINSSSTSVPALLRLTATGALEKSYGPFAAGLRSVNAIAVQSDDRVIIAADNGADFALQRFTTSGAPDASFGTDGLLTVDFFGAADEALDVLVQADGKIVAGGDAKNGTTNGGGLMRVLP